MNFQAAVSAIACIYMARGQRLSWLDRVAEDIPVIIDAETGGAGDDIRLQLKSGETVEVQVKKGLKSGNELWDSLIGLMCAKRSGLIDYGVLIVSSSSSKTITEHLARDLVRLGDGRSDNLSSIGDKLVTQLRARGLPITDSCKFVRIQTISATESDHASILAAQAELANLCSDPTQARSAWQTLYTDSSALIEYRGRRDVSSVLRLLRTEGVNLAESRSAAPLLLLGRLADWTIATHASFSIFGVKKALSVDRAWIALRAVVRDEAETKSESLKDALKNYQAWEERAVPRDAMVVDPETLGRFVTRTIIVGGPGMGKTTLLKRIARRYGEDQIPVLHARLAAIAARMRAGGSFEEAVFELGLDGSGIATTVAKQAAFPNWLLLCDGLDECGRLQEDVAAGAARFAAGHPGCRMLITTRPVGYDTAYFSNWRHYYLAPLETSAAPTHLAVLVGESAPEGSRFQHHTSALCMDELERGEIDSVVARSPLLLGLAASIIVRGGHLGATRERLFEQIFDVIDEVPNSRIPEPRASSAVLRRYLDILGWQITDNPLSPIDKTLQRCANELVRETETRPLQARGEAEAYLNYWQDVGMIERIGHGCDETLAFIHKSFGEFAAARHLRYMPADEQATAIAGIVHSSEWAEVIRFAGMLGLADSVGNILLASTAAGLNEAKRIVRVVQLIAEATPPPEPALRERIIIKAFAVVSSARRLEAFEVGESLVAAARRFPDEIGPSAGAFLNHEQPWTRLIAWAAAVAAGGDHYRLNDLVGVLRSSTDIVGPAIYSSLGSGIVFAGHSGRELVQTFILDAASELIDRSPSELTDAIVREVFNYPHLGSVGFRLRASKLLRSKGKTDQVGWWDKLDWPSMAPPKGLADAQIIAYEAIFDALDLPAPLADADKSSGPLLHFSAFLAGSGFGNIEVSDFRAWAQPFDKAATRETLKGFLGVSGIDLELLRLDAQQAQSYLRTAGTLETSWLVLITTFVDPPVIDWDAARTLNLDVAKIEVALSHRSRWIVWLAANLMEKLLAPLQLEPLVRRLFEAGKGHTLWAACGLAAELKEDQAVALLCERLSRPLVHGCEYLFRLLRRFEIPWGDELSGIVRAGLNGDVDIALEAAKLASDNAKAGQSDLAEIIVAALAYWVEHEEPYPNGAGIIPHSPRAGLIDALMKIRLPSYAELRSYIADPRSDVKDIGKGKLFEWLRRPDGPRAQFLGDVSTGAMPPHLLDKALEARIPLDVDELALATSLLDSENAKIRYNAMSILQEVYLDPAHIRSRVQAMTGDKEQQIRDRAYRILDVVKGSVRLGNVA